MFLGHTKLFQSSYKIKGINCWWWWWFYRGKKEKVKKEKRCFIWFRSAHII